MEELREKVSSRQGFALYNICYHLHHILHLLKMNVVEYY